jgi:pilus assembly protein Flp/PilA
MKKLVDQFIGNEDGATAIEYGLLAAIISISIAVPLGLVSDSLIVRFQTVADNFSN